MSSTPGMRPETVNDPAEEKVVKCQKCGAELLSDQKVCIVCGTRTLAGGNFAIYEKESFQITSGMKKAAAVAGLLLLIIIIASALRVTPPDVVADKWFNLMSQRDMLKADQFTSDNYKSQVQQGLNDSRAISDFIYDELNSKEGKSSVGKAVYTPGTNQATVDITITYPDSSTRLIQLVFQKTGRKWLIEKLVY